MARRYDDPGPATEPDLVAGFKTYARIDFSEHDALVAQHLISAREWFERQTEIVIAERDVVLYLDSFPSWLVEVCYTPATSVGQLVYIDSDGNSTTLDTSHYVVSLGNDRTPCRIMPAESAAGWPATESGIFDAVAITLTLGYADPADIPQRYLDAVYSYAQDLYDNLTPPSSRSARLMNLAERGLW